jgi:DNA polymerase III epsilon subunit-like protein
MYCAIDFETTGLLLPSAAPLEKQPHIVQIACLQCDEELNITNEWMTLVKPPVHIPAEVSKIHGITDEMVKKAPTFKDEDLLAKLKSMTRGPIWLGQNVPFDVGCLYHELRRLVDDPDELGELRFLKGPKADLMDLIIAKWGKRRKLGDVYLDIFGTKMVGAHDALADIKATVACYKALRQELCK